MRNKRVLPALLGSVALTLGLVTVTTSINKEVVNAATGTWTLVKDVSSLEVGDKVIIAAKDSSVALSTTQNNNNRGQASITKSGELLNDPSSSVEILTLEEGLSAGTFSFKESDGYLYCASTSSKNYLRTKNSKDASGSWTIDIASSGIATIRSKISGISRNLLSYNAQSSIFACYSSVQNNICMYEYVEQTTGGDETEAKPEELLYDLVSEYVGDDVYTKITSINIDPNSSALKEDLGTMFHGKMNVESLQKNLNKTTYYNGNELWMTNAEGVNSGYGTVTTKNKKAVEKINSNAKVGHMTHFKYLNNNQVYDYTVAIDGGMEAYYITPKDFVAREDYFSGWEKVSDSEFIYNNPKLPSEVEERNILSDFIDVVAPLLYWEHAGNYFTFDKLVIKEDAEKEELILQIVLDESNATGKLQSTSNNVLAQAIITKGNEDVDFSYKLPGLDKVDFTFEDVTKTNTTKLTPEAALQYFTNDLGENKDVLKELVVENVYEGNGTGGAFEKTSGLLKLGTASNNGKIVLTFDANSKFSTVTIKCHAWNKGDSSKMSVNGVEIGMPNTGVASEITFSITESNVITIEPSARAFIFAISLD